MDGRVVHGKAGQRQEYRPVESILTPSSEPLAVALALVRETACPAMYVADLDAILRVDGHGLDAVERLSEGLAVPLWVDAGVADEAAATLLLEAGASRAIVGTETLRSVGELERIVAALSADSVLASLDISAGAVMSACPQLAGRRPVDALALLAETGATGVILLTLDRVGMGEGPALELLQTARDAFPHLSLIAGGGVRDANDLTALADRGLDGVLIATALHRGAITGAQIRRIGQSC
jgi:phosphoribosylformimino-5-aminoimidazole carboxamide ribotide isomerase